MCKNWLVIVKGNTQTCGQEKIKQKLYLFCITNMISFPLSNIIDTTM